MVAEGVDGPPWRLILSLLVGQLAWCGWLLGCVSETEEEGLVVVCWIQVQTGGVVLCVVPLVGGPSSRCVNQPG